MPRGAGGLKSLERELERVAMVGMLLVVSDYDGTLAAIVDDPELAFPNKKALGALQELGALPDTRAAIISGRSWAELRRLSGGPPNVVLVVGHGAETGPAVGGEETAGLVEVTAALEEIAAKFAGVSIERKPTGVAFHYRKVDPALVDEVLRMVMAGPGSDPRLHMRHGKMVVEFSASAVDKGVALVRIREEWGAEATVFLGDDLTDEDAFAMLGPEDVGIKVGPGASKAGERLADQGQVGGLLANLLELRRGQGRD